MISSVKWVFNKIQKTKKKQKKNKGGNYIFKERICDCSIIKLAFIFQKELCDCLRQRCKTNGTIRRLNGLEEEEAKKRERKL